MNVSNKGPINSPCEWAFSSLKIKLGLIEAYVKVHLLQKSDKTGWSVFLTFLFTFFNGLLESLTSDEMFSLGLKNILLTLSNSDGFFFHIGHQVDHVENEVFNGQVFPSNELLLGHARCRSIIRTFPKISQFNIT